MTSTLRKKHACLAVLVDILVIQGAEESFHDSSGTTEDEINIPLQSLNELESIQELRRCRELHDR